VTAAKYAAYKETGIPWIGLLPTHWEAVPYKHLVDIQNGTDHKHIEQLDGYPVIGSGGAFAYASEFMYDGESVLLGRKGTVDKPLFVTGRFWTVDTMYWTKISPDANPRFAYYVALTIPFDYYSTNTALPSMTKSVLHAHIVARPPHAEQVVISTFLDRETAMIDALVEEQRRLIELLREKRQAVISQAVTKGLNPNAPMKDSGVKWLGEVPELWKVARISNLFFHTDERGSDDLPVLSVSIHSGVSDEERGDQETDRKVSRSKDKSKYKRVASGDLVYNMMRAWQGGFGTVSVTGMVSPAYVVARPRTDFPTSFIERVLRTPNAVEEMRGRSRGVTDFRLRLYWEEFKEIVAALPPKDDADAIVSYLDELDRKTASIVAAAEECIGLLRERRSALISAAVTGKIDVREAD